MNPCACKSASLEAESQSSLLTFDTGAVSLSTELSWWQMTVYYRGLYYPTTTPLSHYPHYYAWTPATGQFAPRLQLLHIKWLGAALSASLQHYCSIVNCEHCSLQPADWHSLLVVTRVPGVSCVCISASAEDKYGNQDNQDIISHSLLSCMHSSSEDESRNQVQGL